MQDLAADYAAGRRDKKELEAVKQEWLRGLRSGLKKRPAAAAAAAAAAILSIVY